VANVIQIVIKQTSSGNAITTVTKQLGRMDNAADNSSGVMSKLTSALGGLGKVALGVGAGGILALGAGLAKTISVGLGFNNAMEQAAARINAFTKDAGLTAEILKTVQERAAKTPFAFDEMASSAAALMPTVRASGESLEFLLEKAEILAASNPLEGLEGASFALKEAVSGDFTSIIERFNLSRSTLNELKDQGVPALEAVGIAMTELGLDTDLVTALAATAEGRWSTFKDTLTTLAGTVTQPIFDTFSQSLGGLNDWLVQVGPQLEAFATVLAGKVAGAISTVQAAIAGFQSGGMGGLLAALGFSPETLEFINSSIAYITEQVNSLVETLTPAFNSIWESLSKLGEAFGAAGVDGDFFMTTLGAIGTFIVDTAIPGFVQLAGILADSLAFSIQSMVEWMIKGHEAFVSVSAFVTDTFIPAFLSLGDTFLSANDEISLVVDLLASLGELINAVLNKALEAMAGLWQNVLWPALQKVGGILKDTLMPAFTSIGQTVKGDVSPALRDFGEGVLPLITEGIEFVNEAVQRTISFFKSLESTVSGIALPDWLQMHSPPPLATALGMIASGANVASLSLARMQQNMMSGAGAADRFIDSLNMGGFAANSMLSNWNDVRDILHLNIGANMDRLATGQLTGADIPRIIGEQAGVWNVPPAMLQGIAEAQGLVGHFTDTFAAFREEMHIQALDKMTQTANQLVGLGSSFASRIQDKMAAKTGKGSIFEALKKFLSGTEESFSFTEMLDPSTGAASATWMYDRNRAQEKYNELLQEQQEQQEAIARAAQQQADLAFLQDQLSVIKMVREAGLSVGEVFGDSFQFGLGASAEGLLAGISNLVGLMVGQIDQDLQIASPSKVLFKKFRDNVGGAMVGGLLAVRPMLEGAVGSMLNPLTSDSAAGGGRVTNNYFNQTVHTRAEQSSVIGDFRTMQLMVG